jgi:hypothetical protein
MANENHCIRCGLFIGTVGSAHCPNCNKRSSECPNIMNHSLGPCSVCGRTGPVLPGPQRRPPNG